MSSGHFQSTPCPPSLSLHADQYTCEKKAPEGAEETILGVYIV